MSVNVYIYIYIYINVFIWVYEKEGNKSDNIYVAKRETNENIYLCSFDDLFIVCLFVCLFCLFFRQRVSTSKISNSKAFSIKIILSVRNKIIIRDKSSYHL